MYSVCGAFSGLSIVSVSAIRCSLRSTITSGDARFLQAARGAARWLASLALPALDDGSGLNWPVEDGQVPTHAFWCHGAGGIGKFFLHAADLNIVPDALDFAARAARTVSRASRWAGPIRCHGLAGNIEFLLDMARATGDPSYWADCEPLARLLVAQVVDGHGTVNWDEDVPDVLTPDYMLGYAGVVACFLRLANLWSSPSPPTPLPHGKGSEFPRPAGEG